MTWLYIFFDTHDQAGSLESYYLFPTGLISGALLVGVYPSNASSAGCVRHVHHVIIIVCEHVAFIYTAARVPSL